MRAASPWTRPSIPISTPCMDFPYPKPPGKWYELKVEANPFPQQIRSLNLIREGLGGSAYMMETVFNPWNVAQKLSSKEEVAASQFDKRRLVKYASVPTPIHSATAPVLSP